MPPVSPKPSSERNIALCYIRNSVTRTEKDLVSPEIQRRNIQRICDSYGWIPEWYVDVRGNKSATQESNRPGWMALKERLANSDVVALVSNDLSRLHRKGARINELLEYVDQHDIKLILADPAKPLDLTTPQGRLQAQVEAVFDEWFSADLSIRRKAYLSHRKSQNKTTGQPPFGTKRNTEGYLVPRDDGAWFLGGGEWLPGKAGELPPAEGAVWRGYFECAKLLLELFVAGKSQTEICQILTRMGFVFRGRNEQPAPIEGDDVRRITHYWVEYGGGVLGGRAIHRRYEEMDLTTIQLDSSKAVLDVDFLYKVGQEVVARSHRHQDKVKPRKSADRYALSRLVYCAHCDALAQTHNNPKLRLHLMTRSRGKYFVHRNGIQCGRVKGQVATRRLNADFAELISQLTATLFPSVQSLTRLKAALFSANTQKGEKEKQAAIKRCERKLEAIKHLYAEGDLSREDYQQRKAAVQQELDLWANHTQEMPLTQHDVQQMLCIQKLAELSEAWPGDNEAEKERMVQSVFEYLVYDLDKQKIVAFKLTPAFEPYLVLEG
jgi:DNA invertase Pin-like site-specific DNA recombinase